MSDQNTTFKETVIALLEQNQADAELIAKYNNADDDQWEASNKLFVILSTFIEDKQKELNQRGKRKSTKKVGKKKAGAYDANSPAKNFQYSP